VNKFNSMFGQVLQIFSKKEFYSAVKATGEEKGAKGFSSWDQFVSMLFCHLGQARSLREISGGLASCFGKLKQFRRVATRYEKTARNYLAVITIATIALWIFGRMAKKWSDMNA
jgi:hypothetical protein